MSAGRAGNKGTAITFIGPEEDQYAGDLVKALKESKAPIPEDLLTMAKEHGEKVKRGEARAHGSGYGGSGFKFDSAEEDKEKDRKKVCPTCLLTCKSSYHVPCMHVSARACMIKHSCKCSCPL